MKSRGFVHLFALVAMLLLLGVDGGSAWARPGTNVPPSISGTPATSIQAGEFYRFLPQASDADGDRLSFSISNKPAWAAFNRKTGELSGTAQTGTTSAIRIRVSDRISTTALAPFDLTVTGATPANTPPVISGTPATFARVGSPYSFLPTASDADGDPLVFSVANKPAWALFNGATGALTGQPTSADIGTTTAITIAVTDGRATTGLHPFDISVQAANQATLSWVAPSSRENGAPLSLTEIAGYRIYHGIVASELNLLTNLPDPLLTRYTITGLMQGGHYFAVTVYDTDGLESARSAVLSKTIP